MSSHRRSPICIRPNQPSLPPGLTNLTGLFITSNQLTNLTLPPDMIHLAVLGFIANPLTTLVLSEPLAASTNLSINSGETIASLRDQGISVYTYPLVLHLVQPRALTGAFQFAVAGPPGVYAVLGSTDLSVWSQLAVLTNQLGSAFFTELPESFVSRKFYRVRLQESEN